MVGECHFQVLMFSNHCCETSGVVSHWHAFSWQRAARGSSSRARFKLLLGAHSPCRGASVSLESLKNATNRKAKKNIYSNITVHYINPKQLQYDKVTLQKKTNKHYRNYITVTVTQVLPEVSPSLTAKATTKPLMATTMKPHYKWSIFPSQKMRTWDLLICFLSPTAY